MKLKSEFDDIEALTQSTENFIENKLIYYTNSLIDLRRLCILSTCIQDMLQITHEEDHSEFVKCFEIISKT